MLIVFCVASLCVAAVLCVASGRSRPWIAQMSFASMLIAAQLKASKVAPIIGDIHVSVAIGVYSMTFLLTDFMSEVHGKAVALKAVGMGLIGSVVVIFATTFSMYVEPAPFWEDQAAFEAVFGAAPRILVASILGFASAQFTDVLTFHKIKSLTGDRFLWLRNNGSTVVGQTVDSVVFYTVGFLGNVPNLIELIAVTCAVKFVIAAADTPMLYFVRHIVYRSRSEETEARIA